MLVICNCGGNFDCPQCFGRGSYPRSPQKYTLPGKQTRVKVLPGPNGLKLEIRDSVEYRPHPGRGPAVEGQILGLLNVWTRIWRHHGKTPEVLARCEWEMQLHILSLIAGGVLLPAE